MLAPVQVSGLALSEPSCPGFPSGSSDLDRGISSAKEDDFLRDKRIRKSKIHKAVEFPGNKGHHLW